MGAGALRPPGGQLGALGAILAGVRDEGGEEPVDADHVRQALAVGDLERLVGPVAQPAHVGAVLGGEHRGAQGAEHVVERGGAFAVGGLGPEAGEDAGLGEFAEAVLGAVLGGEPDLGELAGGEHAVVVDEAKDGAVALGEPPGEGGELLGGAAGARTWMLAGAGDVVVHAGHLRQESAAVNELATGRVACRRAVVGGAGSKVGVRPGARPADRPAGRRSGGCRRAWPLTRETRVSGPAGLTRTLRSRWSTLAGARCGRMVCLPSGGR